MGCLLYTMPYAITKPKLTMPCQMNGKRRQLSVPVNKFKLKKKTATQNEKKKKRKAKTGLFIGLRNVVYSLITKPKIHMHHTATAQHIYSHSRLISLKM